jgi:hypothetical protein
LCLERKEGWDIINVEDERMKKNVILGIMLTLLIMSMLALAFNIQFAMTSDSLSVDVSPKVGPPGTLIGVSVHGATPDGELVRIRIYFNDVNVWNITSSSQYSSWSTAFRVPDVEPGEYTIKALDAVSNTTATAMFTMLPPPPPPKIGVKAGDWIKCTYTISGGPSGTPYPEWLKVEFLSVEGTNATIRVTMHMSDGTEPSQTMTIDVAAGGGAFQGLSGFVIPANCTTGDSIYMSGYGNVTIAGETTSSYAGATRTVVYASFLQYGTQLTYYWDKLTGVMVEASVVSGTMTGTAKAIETNMWQAAPSGLPIEPIYLYISAALVIIIVVGAAVVMLRRKKIPPEEVESSQSKLRLTSAGFKRNFGHRITRV